MAKSGLGSQGCYDRWSDIWAWCLRCIYGIYVYRGTIDSTQVMESAQMSVNRWMDKEYRVYKTIEFQSVKEEWNMLWDNLSVGCEYAFLSLMIMKRICPIARLAGKVKLKTQRGRRAESGETWASCHSEQDILEDRESHKPCGKT